MSAFSKRTTHAIHANLLLHVAALPLLLAPAWCGAQRAAVDPASRTGALIPDTTLRTGGDGRSGRGVDRVAPAVAAERLFDTAAALVHERAYYADRIDWYNAVAELRVAASKAGSTAQAHAQIRALLALLGDDRSVLMQAGTAQQLPRAAAAAIPAEVKLLAGDVGYVRMPPFSSADPQAQARFASDAAEQIAAQATTAREGWIVDLRGTAGGNPWPLLAALRPLLGSAVVGAARDRHEQLREWHAGDDVPGLAGGLGPDLSTARAAVLLDERTAGAGEAVAVAFHGRANTRSFGSSTAGQSSSMAEFALPDGSRLALMVALNLDRHGNLLSPRVEPDQPTTAGDAALAAARAWLTATATGG